MEYQVEILETKMLGPVTSPRVLHSLPASLSPIYGSPSLRSISLSFSLSSPLGSLLFSRLCSHVRDAETDFSGGRSARMRNLSLITFRF